MESLPRLYLAVYDDCNLKCLHCFNEGGKTTGQLLSTAEIIDLIKQANTGYGTQEVQFTGGEPTLRPDLIELMHQVFAQGIKIMLQSNGMISQRTMKSLMEFTPEHLSFIISIDGIDTNDRWRGTGTTDTIIQNLKKLSSKFPTRINCALSCEIQWHEIIELLNITKEYGFSIAFNPICPAGRADATMLMPPKTYFDWMKDLEKYRSSGVALSKCFSWDQNHLKEHEDCAVRLGEAIFIAADGGAYPCGFLSGHPSCYIGSIRDHSLSELIKRIPSFTRELAEQCRDCLEFQQGFCHGGCPARIYALHGRFDQVDYYCPMEYQSESE